MKTYKIFLISLAGLSSHSLALHSVHAQVQRHSDQAASHVLYLDFDGYANDAYEQGSDCYGRPLQILNIHIPAFDRSGDPTVFDASENDFIEDVWERVAEDFSPFDVDVTTERPPEYKLAAPRGIHIVVGGNPDDLRTIASPHDRRGVASRRENTALVVERFGGRRTARSIAQTASHEAGHLLAAWTGLADVEVGMTHYGAAHDITATGRTQIVGFHTDSYPALKRDIWWAHDPVLVAERRFDRECNRLPSPVDIIAPQEDIAILMAALDLRKDDHGGDAMFPAGQPNSPPVPQPQHGTALVRSGSDLVIAPTGEDQQGVGIIRMNAVSFPRYCMPWGDPSVCRRIGVHRAAADDRHFLAIVEDLDFFRFAVTAQGQFQARAHTINDGNSADDRANLHLDLELWRKVDGRWTQLRQTANVPLSSLGARISHTAATGATGEYAVAVKSKGEYGDLGQYSLRVSGSNVEPVP